MVCVFVCVCGVDVYVCACLFVVCIFLGFFFGPFFICEEREEHK